MVAFAVEAAQGAGKDRRPLLRRGHLHLPPGRDRRRLCRRLGRAGRRRLKAAIGPAPGLKPITAEARDLVRRPVLSTELAKTDVVVIDPPRAGAYEQTVEIAKSKVGKVVSVSCNPATFARDAKMLVDAGFKLEKVLPVDQFVWSPHIELVGVFSR
jgi:23S rRNA (uracil1939-C5)-methyltransferase